MILQVILLAMAVMGGHCTTSADRQAMLDCHNKYRAQLALGKVSGQPSAADMTVMDYDTKIEARATNWNDNCKAGHDDSSNRLVNEDSYKPFTWIGQNWAGFTSGAVSRSCDMWWDEYKDYSYDSNASINGKAVGHYTQMAWSKSTIVGCGINKSCSNAYGQHITCNYATGGNFNGAKPYKVGTACSQCPDGYNYCMGGALCARKDQCDASATACTCAIKSCENGGTLNNCKCTCQSGSYGDRCQNKCEDMNQYCKAPYNVDCANSYWKNQCKAKCGGCKAAEPFVTGAAGAKVQVPGAETGSNTGTNTGTNTDSNTGTNEATTAAPAPAVTTAGTNPECKDYSESYCTQYKSMCSYCPLVKASCGKTCNTCDYAAECADRYWDKCPATIEAWGGCRGQLNFICRKSCNQCSGSQSQPQTETNTGTANPACTDYSESYCTQYKSMCSYCPLVKASCGKTCNTCDYQAECADRYWDKCAATIESWGGCRGQLNYICKKSCNKC